LNSLNSAWKVVCGQIHLFVRNGWAAKSSLSRGNLTAQDLFPVEECIGQRLRLNALLYLRYA